MPQINLTPITRLSMSLDIEMEMDRNGVVFNQATFDRYKEIYAETVHRRDSLFRSVAVANGILLLLLFGKNLRIPGLDISILDIPAGLEIALLLASFSFMFAAIAFVNEQSYLAILNQFSIRATKQIKIDPDFLAASHSLFEFALKLYRKKFNIWGVDFYEPGGVYRVVFGALLALMTLSLLLFLAFHLLSVGVAMWSVWYGTAHPLVSKSAAVLSLLPNIAGLLVLLTMSISFRFDTAEAPKASAGVALPPA